MVLKATGCNTAPLLTTILHGVWCIYTGYLYITQLPDDPDQEQDVADNDSQQAQVHKHSFN